MKTKPPKETVDLKNNQNHYLGVKLRHTRMTKGLRLRDLAEKAECSESMLSKIENDRAVPSLKTLYRIGVQVRSHLIARKMPVQNVQTQFNGSCGLARIARPK